MIKTTLSLLLASTLVACTSVTETPKEEKVVTVPEVKEDVIIEEEPPVIALKVENFRYTCEECTIQEQMALDAFQNQGITDRYALAALMGNIKQESKFLPDICEGGARVKYENCRRGGFGLIQWTTVGRYDGLGRHAKLNDCNPNTTACQLDYLFTEREWKITEPYMKTNGKSIEWYMQHAYKWLGWGIHGARTDYAYNYTRMFSPHP